MPTIKVEEVTCREVEVEVHFPVYSKHDMMLDECDSVKFMRWDADGTLWSIQCTEYPDWSSGSQEYENTRERRQVDGSFREKDYVLGMGVYACTADEFNEVLLKAREFLAGIDL